MIRRHPPAVSTHSSPMSSSSSSSSRSNPNSKPRSKSLSRKNDKRTKRRKKHERGKRKQLRFVRANRLILGKWRISVERKSSRTPRRPGRVTNRPHVHIPTPPPETDRRKKKQRRRRRRGNSLVQIDNVVVGVALPLGLLHGHDGGWDSRQILPGSPTLVLFVVFVVDVAAAEHQ